MLLDDDAFIRSPVGFNIVETFDKQGYLMAARNIVHDIPWVTWGLPELVRYYLVTHKVVPATLFEHCNPPNLTGLYSTMWSDSLHQPTEGGWDRMVIFTNLVMWNLDWWFSPLVNRFVHLCVASGGVVDQRWNEQAVITMAWQIFVRKEQFFMFNFSFEHTKGSYIADQFFEEHKLKHVPSPA
ncbi:hypothetical protein VOLCADRAFT_92164 [Volvox carteri f. nagariensis]|uniref:Uncharacterized protein n=1 Tax=Volvox carteri f. nagariensis TaxID=3068 RepID=D8TYS6_VOLCA|nr:uncharacterized protein VOLCADRAFT_92164 [Volvox carteri f. nagariensis]EFJ47445.1 hypothetical protein VOLCADRAFT_92164 [Volvox carteri f. nagariensis]|eukprot:XP_002951634.1 hypothetical protein VOLCADRAFT_92164 [Volvox carteri f. nagariensis]